MSDYTSYHDYDTWPYTVIDLETSVKNKGETAIGSMAASPFHPDNNVVLGGIYYKGFYPVVSTKEEFMTRPTKGIFHTHIVVGHNIKFDLLYFFKIYNGDKDIVDWLLNKVLIWDTMIVEYLITGQQDKFTSLDALSKKYGGTLKDSNIKKYWEDGIDTEDIPQEELKEYLIEDLKNTELVYLKQKEQVAKMSKGMLPLIYMEMESLKDTILAEWNGMYVSMDKLGDNAKDLHQVLLKVEDSLKTVNPEINWSSPVQLQAFLFGGKVKVGFKDEPTGTVYKTGPKKGMMKTKKVAFEPTYPGFLLSTNTEYALPFSDTSEESLHRCYMIIDGTKALWSHYWSSQLWLITQIQLYRKLYKDFNTYYAGIAKLIWPNDSCVHANFNHCATDTGRLSCSSPNLQNITSKE